MYDEMFFSVSGDELRKVVRTAPFASKTLRMALDRYLQLFAAQRYVTPRTRLQSFFRLEIRTFGSLPPAHLSGQILRITGI